MPRAWTDTFVRLSNGKGTWDLARGMLGVCIGQDHLNVFRKWDGIRGHGLDWSDLGQEQVAGTYTYCNEPSCSVNCGEFDWSDQIAVEVMCVVDCTCVRKFRRLQWFMLRYAVQFRGTTVAQWLSCCATNQKVAVSIPFSVTGIFHWHKILSIALWSWGRLSL